MTLQMLLGRLEWPPTINQNKQIMAYKFRKKEVEEMKIRILSHCESYNQFKGEFNAKALRFLFEEMIEEPFSKRKKQIVERKLALYEKLTLDDKPNW